MNIIENKKKIAIIGKGTAGSISAAHYTYYANCEIEWYRDPLTSTQSVGEASTLTLPRLLKSALNTHYTELNELHSTTKRGIRKLDWGINGSKDFIHDFSINSAGIHFDAVKLQNFIAKKLKNHIKIVESKSLSHSEIDATYIIDCTGKPLDYTPFNISKSTPINSAYVVNCYWDYPKYEYSFHIARPYGWVFGIPLKNRISIGYMYNSNINNLDEIKEDINNIFKKLNLTPSYDVTQWFFKNYYRKQNHTQRVTYNGNSSFFLEPLESTSTTFMDFINKNTLKLLSNEITIEEANKSYLNEMEDIQRIIALHYYSGSSFKTNFWEYAFELSQNFLKDNIKNVKFKNLYNFCKKFSNSNALTLPPDIMYGDEIGLWPTVSYIQNFEGLGLYNKIDKLLNT
jgi:hypothetical protein